MTTVDLPGLRRWVGREVESTQVMELDGARDLARLLNHDAEPQNGGPLQLPWHWLYFNESVRRSGVGDDGHPKRGDFLPPVPLPRRMWAAGRMELLQPLVIGLPAAKLSRVSSVSLKEGKSGPLVFVGLEHRLSQYGTTCLVEEQTLVYRHAPTAPEPRREGERAAHAADWSMRIVPDTHLLFRYSALTHNGHRIHYDRDYAKAVELYPALVVHGPLLATLMLDLLVRSLPDARVLDFRFRAQRPSFDTDLIDVNGRRDGNTVYLWTTDTEGFIGMSATATLEAP